MAFAHSGTERQSTRAARCALSNHSAEPALTRSSNSSTFMSRLSRPAVGIESKRVREAGRQAGNRKVLAWRGAERSGRPGATGEACGHVAVLRHAPRRGWRSCRRLRARHWTRSRCSKRCALTVDGCVVEQREVVSLARRHNVDAVVPAVAQYEVPPQQPLLLLRLLHRLQAAGAGQGGCAQAGG